MSFHKQLRAMSLFLLLITIATCFCFPIGAESANPPTAKNVDAACVINVEHRKVVIDENMKKIIFPASTTKLMTALVAAEYFSKDLNMVITVSEEMLVATKGRNLGLKAGEILRVKDLLYALLVGGYNDAAVILAFATAGSINAFCKMMNERAKSMGALNTNYTNPTGLHDDAMVTTAYDTALVGIAILKNETLFTITKTLKYVISATNKSEDRTIYNRNPLITTSMTEEYYYSYAEGMSAGATDEGGDCVVTAGRLDGLSYVCVAMGGRPSSANDDSNYACLAAEDLLRYALVNYEVRPLYSEKITVTTIPIRFSATEEMVGVKPSRSLSALLYTGVDLEKEVKIDINVIPSLLEAPIQQGDVVGTITATYNGEVVDSADLITTDSIEAHGFLIFMFRVKQVTQHPLFILILVLAVGYIIYLLLKRFPTRKGKDTHKRNRYF